MEAFSIECTTCRARLKVRDESAIGQILTCPKCSSMVLVERPGEQLAEEDSSPDLSDAVDQSGSEPVAAPAALAKRNAADSDPSLDPPVTPAAQAPPGQHPPAHSAPTTDANPSNPSGPLSDTVEDLSVYGTQQPPAPAEVPLPTVPDSLLSEQPLLPTDAWSSESSQRVRNWLLLGGAATIGIFVAVGVFALVAMRLSQNADVVAGDHSVPDPKGGTAGETLTDIRPPPTAGDPNAAPAIDGSADPPDQVDPVGSGPDGSTPATIPPIVVDPVVGAPPTHDDDPPGFVAADVEETPPGFVTGDDTTASADASLDKTLRNLEGLLDVEPADHVPPPMADLETPEPEPKRPEPRFVNVAERLADTFEEIQFDGTALNDFLRFVASFSTIPITLDADAFFWLEATPATPVSAHQKSATVQLLVQTVVESVGLTTEIVGDQLLVTLPEEGVLRKVYTINDLATSEVELQAMAGLLPNLIARDAWQTAGGLGSIVVSDEALTIQQSTRVHREVLRFFEKLRVARGLSPASTTLPAANFELASRFARVQKQLEKNITLNFFQPTPLDQVTDRLAKFAGCQILIDWQSLQQAGWNANTMVTLTVSDTPLSKTLDDLLAPMGLGYRCVDAGLLQITSVDRLKRESEVELYPISDLLAGSNAEAMMTKLRDGMGPVWGLDRGVMEFDAASGTLLAAFPQKGQIALEKSLAALRAETRK